MAQLEVNDIPNGSIYFIGPSAEPILFVRCNNDCYGYSLKYGNCWYYPNDSLKSLPVLEKKISYKICCIAQLKLQDLFAYGWMQNLDYVEALARIKNI